MAKRFIDTGIWDKAWFMDLSPSEKCLFIYMLSKANSIGVYHVNRRLAESQIGTMVDFDASIKAFEDQIEWLGDDKVWIRDFCTFQYGELSESCKPHQKYIQELKNLGLFERVSKGYSKGYPKGKNISEYPSENVVMGIPKSSKGMYTLQEKEKEKDKEKEKEKEEEKTLSLDTGNSRRRFIPPSVDEVKSYCQERSNGIDAQHFVDYYTANGWRVGKNPMKDWHAAVRTWEKQGTAKPQQPAKSRIPYHQPFPGVDQ